MNRCGLNTAVSLFSPPIRVVIRLILDCLFSLFPITEPEENALEDILRVEVELLGQSADSATGRGVNRYLDAFHGVTGVTACL